MFARRVQGVWQVMLDGYWGEGYTQNEAIHHAKFRKRLHEIVQSTDLVRNTVSWSYTPLKMIKTFGGRNGQQPGSS